MFLNSTRHAIWQRENSQTLFVTGFREVERKWQIELCPAWIPKLRATHCLIRHRNSSDQRNEDVVSSALTKNPDRFGIKRAEIAFDIDFDRHRARVVFNRGWRAWYKLEVDFRFANAENMNLTILIKRQKA